MGQPDDPSRRVAENYPIQFQQRLLYADMDGSRHLNNGATSRLFEEGRATLNLQVFGPKCLVDPEPGERLLFANLNVDFLLQAYYPGTVEICTGVARVGNSSCVVAQAAFQNGQCFALSEAVMVKAINGKPAPLSATQREALQKFAIRNPHGTLS